MGQREKPRALGFQRRRLMHLSSVACILGLQHKPVLLEAARLMSMRFWSAAQISAH